ncbi:MAG: hypothetical protein H6696_14640 [Deferribacteres bacterium]|nr:hypothetical protein [Deferribacteres bacterium]
MESVIVLDAEPVGCSMMEMEQDCEKTLPAPQTVQEDNCCENTYQILQLKVENFAQVVELSKVQLSDFAVSHTLLNLQEISSNCNLDFSYYQPPPPKQDISILIQSFLI